MKNINNAENAKKILLILTLIFTLSTGYSAPYYSMDPRLTSESFQTLTEKESMKNVPLIEPKTSAVTLDVTKTSDILVGLARNVRVVGTLAYVADRLGGLRIIDISDPTAPVGVGKFYDGGEAFNIYVSGSYAYVADRYNGLEIIDISNPTSPVEVGQYYDGGDAFGVYISGSYAYVADRDDGLEIIDISNPTSPVEVGQYYDGGAAYDVCVSGSYAYVADYDNGLEIIDISDPTTPVEVGQYYNVSANSFGVKVSGSYAYLADGSNGFKIINITDPTTPVQVGKYFDYGSAYDVHISGSYAYLAYSTDGLMIIDISNPATPKKKGSFYDGRGQSQGLYVSGSYAYVADYYDGLEIIDISDPTAPIEVGELDEGGHAHDVSISGSYAYVAENYDGLVIIDISDPTAPVEVAQYYVGGRVNGVFVSGSYAYVANRFDYGLRILNISDPTAPVEVGQIKVGGGTTNVYVSGSYAYVADGPHGLAIVDISDPTSPVEVGECYDAEEAYDVYVSGSYAYVACYYKGLVIIDISDPTSPVEVGRFDEGGNVFEVFVSGSYAYVADIYKGLKIFDISDPTSPVEVGECYDGGKTYGVYVSGSYAYMASHDDGLEIIDISDPTLPVEVGQFYDGGSARRIIVSGDYVYVADNEGGLEILHVTELTLTITDPISSSSWEMETSHYIYWESTGSISMVNIELFKDGVFEFTIASHVLNHGYYYWTLPSGLNNSANYQIKITDSFHSSVYDYSEYFEIYMNSISITAPDSLSQWEMESSHFIYWETTGYISMVNIELFKDGVFESTIASNVLNDNSYNWTIPYGLDNSVNYQIKITDAFNSSVYDYSDNFEIYTILITSPDNLSSWEIGSSHYIYWESTEYISTINIELYKEGAFDSTIVLDVSNNESYFWTLPSGLDDSANYQIKITNASDSSIYDFSDNFGIYANLFTITAPNSTSSWEIGSSHYIYLESMTNISTVLIELYRDGIFERIIASDFLNNSYYYWTLPLDLGDATNYQVKITDTFDSSVYAYSDNFEIYIDSITITTPDTSSSWEIDSSQYIYWDSTGYISTVNIDLFRNGIFESTIASDVSNDGSYYWMLPSGLGNSTNYQIKIIDATDDNIYDLSDHFEIFNISDNPDNPDNPDDSSISGYNPLLLLSATVGISFILMFKKRRNIYI